jgi:hypothetical protein
MITYQMVVEFCNAYGFSLTGFGTLACDNPKVPFRLRDGKGVAIDQHNAAQRFMDEYALRHPLPQTGEAPARVKIGEAPPITGNGSQRLLAAIFETGKTHGPIPGLTI